MQEEVPALGGSVPEGFRDRDRDVTHVFRTLGLAGGRGEPLGGVTWANADSGQVEQVHERGPDLHPDERTECGLVDKV
jgi:hypothetical protein